MAEEAQEGRKQHLEPAELIVRSPQHASVENRHALSLNGHQVHVPVSRLGHLESCASPRACLLLLGHFCVSKTNISPSAEPRASCRVTRARLKGWYTGSRDKQGISERQGAPSLGRRT